MTTILRRANYETCEAINGSHAFDTLEAHHPVDLVLTDVLMPQMSGIEFLEHARQQYPTTPVILMSAYPRADWVRDARRKGAAFFLPKPFSRQQLVLTVEFVLKQKERNDLTGFIQRKRF